MFNSDHQNLLSTFGKDSQSSQVHRGDNKNHIKNANITVNKKYLLFDNNIEPKSRYQQILQQRKAQMGGIDKVGKNGGKKNTKDVVDQQEMKNIINTEGDIEYLNSRIRKSISGIAESICKSKITSRSNVNIKMAKVSQFQHKSSLKKNVNHQHYISQSHKNINSKKRQSITTTIISTNKNKQNLDINGVQMSKKKENKQNLSRNEYLKNSTKKKTVFFEEDSGYPIKSSFSIDLNSHASSRIESSSRKRSSSKRKSQEEVERIFGVGDFECLNSNNNFNKLTANPNPFIKLDSEFIMNKQMQETLKKQSKHNNQPNDNHHHHHHHDHKNKLSFESTKGSRTHKFNNNDFFFYDYEDKKQNLSNNNNIDMRKRNRTDKRVSTEPVEEFTVEMDENKDISTMIKQKQYHPLINALVKQIELDYDLRHAKHMFSGIEEPFGVNRDNHNVLFSSSELKWSKLNEQLKKIGLNYSVSTIKKLFLPTEQQLDPFLSAGKPHQQLVYSLIFAYQKAEIHWQENIYQKWQHWDLRDIDFTIECIDRNRKGFISVQDLTAFLGLQTGIEYKNRDLVLVYRRFLTLGSLTKGLNTCDDGYEQLKFRSLIDSLIIPFRNNNKTRAVS